MSILRISYNHHNQRDQIYFRHFIKQFLNFINESIPSIPRSKSYKSEKPHSAQAFYQTTQKLPLKIRYGHILQSYLSMIPRFALLSPETLKHFEGFFLHISCYHRIPRDNISLRNIVKHLSCILFATHRLQFENSDLFFTVLFFPNSNVFVFLASTFQITLYELSFDKELKIFDIPCLICS